MSELFLVIFYHDQITAILVTENIAKYVKLFHHSPNVQWKCTIWLISGSLPAKFPSKNLPRKKFIKRFEPKNCTKRFAVKFQEVFDLMWPVRTEMVISTRKITWFISLPIVAVTPFLIPITLNWKPQLLNTDHHEISISCWRRFRGQSREIYRISYTVYHIRHIICPIWSGIFET